MRSIHSICSGLLVGFAATNLATSGIDIASVALLIVSLVSMITWFAYLHQITREEMTRFKVHINER